MKKFLDICFLCMLSVLLISCGSNTSSDSSDNQKLEFKSNNRSKEWDDPDCSPEMVQIDDVFYIPGLSIDEIVNRIKKSKCKYEYNYNPEENVSAGQIYELEIYKDEMESICIKGVNPTEEDKSAKDCVFLIAESNNFINEDARFLDGRSIQEIKKMTYDDIIGIKDTILKDYYVEEYMSKNMGKDTIEISFSLFEQKELNNSVYQDYAIFPWRIFKFSLFKETGELNTFDFYVAKCSSYMRDEAPIYENKAPKCDQYSSKIPWINDDFYDVLDKLKIVDKNFFYMTEDEIISNYGEPSNIYNDKFVYQLDENQVSIDIGNLYHGNRINSYKYTNYEYDSNFAHCDDYQIAKDVVDKYFQEEIDIEKIDTIQYMSYKEISEMFKNEGLVMGVGAGKVSIFWKINDYKGVVLSFEPDTTTFDYWDEVSLHP